MTSGTGRRDRLRLPEVVVVAASTGGPGALRQFFQAFRSPPPVPFVVVQHMPDAFTGRLAARLDADGPLRVREAASGDRLEPGVALVAPGGRHLRWRAGRFMLSTAGPVGGLRPRADLTIADLAAGFGPGLCAVVLTGMGEDGREGAAAVRATGGQVLVQDAGTAVVDGMPRQVREDGEVHLDADPASLAAALARTWREPAPRPDRDRKEHEVVEQVVEVLRRLDQLDAGSVRRSHLARRLRAFGRAQAIPPGELVDRLTLDADLRHRLAGSLTVNVTAFFRDPDRWRALEAEVVPDLPRAPRVWCAACADGSEAYSVAMVLAEHGLRPQVVATDVDAAVLATGRAGRYDARQVRNVPDPLVARWFTATGEAGHPRRGGLVEVVPELRRRVRFLAHDALEGAGTFDAGRFDLVVCRNLAIYLTDEGRHALFDQLVAALRPGGHLFLGRADSLVRPDRHGLVPVASGLLRRVAPVVAPGPLAGAGGR